MGATFQMYEARGFAGELLPIAPPGSPQSPKSAIAPESVGKVPMMRGRGGWFGCKAWQDASYSTAETARFQASGAGIGIQARAFPALDIDVTQPDAAAAIEALALEVLGDAPARIGRAPKVLLPYRGDVGKRSVSFTLPSSDERQLVEVLGRGNFWVAEGVHPKTGQPYSWPRNRRAADQLALIDEEKLDAFFEALERRLEDLGARDIWVSGRGASFAAKVAAADLLAPSLDRVRQALLHVPNHGDAALDYDRWLAVLSKIKGASGEDGLEIAHEWSSGALTGGEAEANSKYDPDDTERRWQSIQPRTGWPELARMAQESSGGAFNTAEDEFTALEEGAPSSLTELAAAVRAAAGSFVYCEPTGEWVRIRDGRVMKKEVFNDTAEARLVANADLSERVRSWREAGAKGPRPSMQSPHRLLIPRVRVVQEISYCPAQPQIYDSASRHGGCGFNTYVAPPRPFAGRRIADEEVLPFLELVEWVFPDATSATLLLDWMSFIAQNPGAKIQWAPVLFSITQGVGKDTVLRVLRYGVTGEDNVASIPPHRVEGEFNADWAPKQVVLVDELPSYQKRDLYDRLKALVASGAGSISVNPKGLARYEMPNLQCWCFTTNKSDALALETTDRRFVILQAREERMSEDIRTRFNAWGDWNDATRSGSRRGYHLAGEWLRQRSISASFSPFECNVSTEAKEQMRKEARGPLQEYLEDGIADRNWPFNADLIALKDITVTLPSWVTNRATIAPRRVASTLKGLGCRSLDRVYLGPAPAGCSKPNDFNPKQMTLVAVRDVLKYAAMDPRHIADEFWRQRRAAEAERESDGSLEEFLHGATRHASEPPAELQASLGGAGA
jgi:hypothetical protein